MLSRESRNALLNKVWNINLCLTIYLFVILNEVQKGSKAKLFEKKWIDYVKAIKNYRHFSVRWWRWCAPPAASLPASARWWSGCRPSTPRRSLWRRRPPAARRSAGTTRMSSPCGARRVSLLPPSPRLPSSLLSSPHHCSCTLCRWVEGSKKELAHDTLGSQRDNKFDSEHSKKSFSVN